MSAEDNIRIVTGCVGAETFYARVECRSPHGIWHPFQASTSLGDRVISGEDDEEDESGDVVTETVEEPGVPPPIPKPKVITKTRVLTQREVRKMRRAKRRALRRAMKRAYDASISGTALDLVPGVPQTLAMLDLARKLYLLAQKGDGEAKGRFIAMLKSPDDKERRVAEAAKKLFQ